MKVGDDVYMTNYNNIPKEMKEFNNWVLYKIQSKKDSKGNIKNTKIPYQPINKMAKVNNNNTWSSFATVRDKAENEANRYDGIGFVFTNSTIMGIDIDHCVIDNKLSDIATDILKTVNSYAEYSPSGEGIHIYINGNINLHNGFKLPRLGLEIYDKDRYFTVTGNVIKGYEKLSSDVTGVEKIYSKYFDAKLNSQQKEIIHHQFVEIDDNKLLDKICSSKQAEAFKNLYYEGIASDNSSADLSLCNMLAFWTCKNFAQMDRLFRKSALYRKKWDEIHYNNGETYGMHTLNKAIKNCPNIYDPNNPANDFEVLTDELISIEDLQYPFTTKKGKPLTNIWQNTNYLLNRLGYEIKYNILRKNIEVFERGILKKMAFDNIVTYLLSLCNQCHLTISSNMLAQHLAYIAEEHKYSPVREYLKKCKNKWDKKSRIKDLFNCLELETNQDNEFCYILFKKWLLSCAVMAFNEGDKSAHGILILCGGQGIGKTRFLYDILPDEGKDWGADGLALNPTNKDDVLRIAMYWIVELGEINDTIKSERLERLKAFITAKKDILRKPYARGTDEMARTTALYGTVNTKEFLRDSTGERRYWVISVENIHSERIKNIDIDQLWGEVAHLALEEKAPYWLTKDETIKINIQNEHYKNLTEAERTIIDCLDWGAELNKWKLITATELCFAIQQEYNTRQCSNRQLAKAIRSLKKSSILGDSAKYIKLPTNHHVKNYYLPPVKKVNNNEFDVVDMQDDEEDIFS